MLGRRGKGHFRCREFIGELDFFEGDIVRVHMLALFDGPAGPSDPLAVAIDMFARLDPHQRHFMARRHAGPGLEFDAFNAQSLPRRERHARDRDIVARMQVNRRVFCRRQFLNF